MSESPAQRWRKKPVIIEAMPLVSHDTYLWVESHVGSYDYTMPQGSKPDEGVTIDPATGNVIIMTLEGEMRASWGDYIIRGIQGEFYPCKPDIFEQSYERMEDE